MPHCSKYPKRDVKVYFRTEEMGSPSILYEENSEYPDEIALLTTFVPTFEPKGPQDIQQDERPSELELSLGKDFLFVFIVDCSGSMEGNRIDLTKKAL